MRRIGLSSCVLSAVLLVATHHASAESVVWETGMVQGDVVTPNQALPAGGTWFFDPGPQFGGLDYWQQVSEASPGTLRIFSFTEDPAAPNTGNWNGELRIGASKASDLNGTYATLWGNSTTPVAGQSPTQLRLAGDMTLVSNGPLQLPSSLSNPRFETTTAISGFRNLANAEFTYHFEGPALFTADRCTGEVRGIQVVLETGSHDYAGTSDHLYLGVHGSASTRGKEFALWEGIGRDTSETFILGRVYNPPSGPRKPWRSEPGQANSPDPVGIQIEEVHSVYIRKQGRSSSIADDAVLLKQAEVHLLAGVETSECSRKFTLDPRPLRGEQPDAQGVQLRLEAGLSVWLAEE